MYHHKWSCRGAGLHNYNKNVEGCRDGSAKNYRKLGVGMAVFRQNMLYMYKDYTGIYSIPTSLFIPKIILHSVVMLRDYWEEEF